MKTLTSLYTFCVCFPYLLIASNAKLYDSFLDRFSCPDPEEFVQEYSDYDIECVDASIPPWPMCLFHNVTYFIEASVASASRCCDFENLEMCRCPVKDTPTWLDVMGEWCPKIAKCPMPDGNMTMFSPLVSDAWTMNVMEGLMMGDFDEEDDMDDEDGLYEDDYYGNDEE